MDEITVKIESEHELTVECMESILNSYCIPHGKQNIKVTEIKEPMANPDKFIDDRRKEYETNLEERIKELEAECKQNADDLMDTVEDLRTVSDREEACKEQIKELEKENEELKLIVQALSDKVSGINPFG